MWGDLLLFVAVGFAAQLIDGAIGMAYGISATTVLLAFGTSPVVASASVHAAEVFTTGASGFFHWRFGNIRWVTVRNLALPGMMGGVLGAYLLTVVPGQVVRPFVSGYLCAIGAVIVAKALRRTSVVEAHEFGGPPVRWLGLCGGFVDAVGGGGWGPLVTSTLIGRGSRPRFAIGSANLAEFFVTATTAGTFVFTVGLELWPTIAGLIMGGAVASPFAAYATRRIPDRPLMILVGCLVMLLSLRSLIEALSS